MRAAPPAPAKAHHRYRPPPPPPPCTATQTYSVLPSSPDDPLALTNSNAALLRGCPPGATSVQARVAAGLPCMQGCGGTRGDRSARRAPLT